MDFWPITRETLAYLTSVIALVVILNDNKVEWFEAATLISLYILYLIGKYYRITKKLDGGCNTKFFKNYI